MPKMLHSLRAAVSAVLVLVALGAGAAASAQDVVAMLLTQQEMERQLLADDLRLYAAARDGQRAAEEKLETRVNAIDAEIEGRQVTLGSLEVLDQAVVRAEESVSAARRSAGQLRSRILERLRRMALLGDRLEVFERQTGVRLDPVSGRWRLQILPQRQNGQLHLRLSGTLVNGFYELEDPSGVTLQGSVRGTYTGGKLSLDRIDARTGFDSTWTGELDPARREIRGRWQATDISSGGPASGAWSAVRVSGIGADTDEPEATPSEGDETP